MPPNLEEIDNKFTMGSQLWVLLFVIWSQNLFSSVILWKFLDYFKQIPQIPIEECWINFLINFHTREKTILKQYAQAMINQSMFPYHMMKCHREFQKMIDFFLKCSVSEQQYIPLIFYYDMHYVVIFLHFNQRELLIFNSKSTLFSRIPYQIVKNLQKFIKNYLNMDFVIKQIWHHWNQRDGNSCGIFVLLMCWGCSQLRLNPYLLANCLEMNIVYRFRYLILKLFSLSQKKRDFISIRQLENLLKKGIKRNSTFWK
ncbi:hypothetical protein M0811_13193 [Anaeramoeba ignava]|uniref:Ubiquitin-like protease family profile domain-containing protein n=1 Tax=Anaeramoeba ignava TaxID=1746090 RepID=A0A9Q0L7E4_ANAIG|nr:hypothetical protein M0811_13193 [Anaeramoeba ignava]